MKVGCMRFVVVVAVVATAVAAAVIIVAAAAAVAAAVVVNFAERLAFRFVVVVPFRCSSIHHNGS